MARIIFAPRLVCLLCGLIWAVASVPSSAQTKPNDRTQARLLVEGLVNRNPVPKIENRSPEFDAKFDWKE